MAIEGNRGEDTKVPGDLGLVTAGSLPKAHEDGGAGERGCREGREKDGRESGELHFAWFWDGLVESLKMIVVEMRMQLEMLCVLEEESQFQKRAEFYFYTQCGLQWLSIVDV